MRNEILNNDSFPVKTETRRIKREKKTIYEMIRIYCGNLHNTDETLCKECRHVYDYAEKRLICCPLMPDKPVCSNCHIHCYKQDMREKIKKVMRYSGPRITYKHPVLAFMHLYDKKLK